MGVIFVAGVHGVGKSTLCSKFAEEGIPSFDASALIQRHTGEAFGTGKVTATPQSNQAFLRREVDMLVNVYSLFFLCGHFCLFDKDLHPLLLPLDIFSQLHLERILLLEAPVASVVGNMEKRDGVRYSAGCISDLMDCERRQAHRAVEQCGCPLVQHSMKYSELDFLEVREKLGRI